MAMLLPYGHSAAAALASMGGASSSRDHPLLKSSSSSASLLIWYIYAAWQAHAYVFDQCKLLTTSPLIEPSASSACRNDKLLNQSINTKF